MRPPGLQRFLRRELQRTGGIARLVALLPRVDAWLLTGPRWKVAYLGDRLLFNELIAALFPDGVEDGPLPRVAAWKLPEAAGSLLTEVDLVVCGLPASWPRRWLPAARWQAQCPVFVDMVVDLETKSPECLAAGRANKQLRWELNAARRAGFTRRVTRSFEDLVQFHAELYTPHVVRRHGPRALIATARSQWRDWVRSSGELLLLEIDGKPVAGVTLAHHGDSVFLGEEGISQEIADTSSGRWAQVALKAAALDRALERGAKRLHLGHSLARESDRGLKHKRKWVARPVLPERSLYPTWTLLADRLPRPLADHLRCLQLHDLARLQPIAIATDPPDMSQPNGSAG